ncbi:hypothetical protein [Rhizobium sp. BK176]|uniref:hypothetical protein n=1 Tax=Rhizobium sp. BK176 TaxID=2587071 RepID=UPI0021678386|nr:hypothetical protein [Rhizobium sp. BK176]MCS4088876.1 hypothetical protein [Rhizobium sp. BK176]
MPYTDLEQAIDIDSLTLAALEAGSILVKSNRNGYLTVAREGDTIRVSNPWRQGSARFEIAADGEHTAAYWKKDGKTFLAPSVPIGLFIDNELELPFFDLNVPVAGIDRDVTDYDSRS